MTPSRNKRWALPSFELNGPVALAQAGVVAGFLAGAIVLGGASSAGITPNAILQIAAVIAIAAVSLRPWPRPPTIAERQLLGLFGLLVLLYVVQTIPLPPGVWQALPGRQVVTSGLATLGILPPAMPLSLAPALTLRSGVALLPPLAMILLIVGFQRPVARVAIVTLLGLMLVSVLLGVAQFSGGHPYFYAFSNGGNATGFFPNSNHFATLMCMCMPLAAALVARWRVGGGDGRAVASRAFAIAVLIGVVLLGLLGIAMTASVAGVMLSLVAIIGSATIVLSGLPRRVRLGLFAAVLLVILLAGAVVFSGTLGTFATATSGDDALGRPMMWRVTAHAIGVFGVGGTGFGSFAQVFHLFEDPSRVTTTYTNHAHNDLLEFVLEGGIPGAALLLLFLVWFAHRVLRVWLLDRQRDPLAQGAAVAAIVVLLHSLVDYPLRTSAIATVFALCLALLARGSGNAAAGEDTPAEALPGRHLSA